MIPAPLATATTAATAGIRARRARDPVGLVLLDLLVEVGDVDAGRRADRDAGLDRGPDVVGVHVAVPDAVAADDDDRVAERVPRGRNAGIAASGASRRYITS